MIADGPEAVNLFRLIALRSAVSLESKGLKSRRFGSMRKKAALEMGLLPMAKHQDVMDALTRKIEEIHASGVGFEAI